MSFLNGNSNGNAPVFIFAGYEEDMRLFLQLNSGLARRIKTTLTFENYKPNELAEITKGKLNAANIRFPHDIDEMLKNCFGSLTPEIISSHNAGLCDDLIDCIQTAQEKSAF